MWLHVTLEPVGGVTSFYPDRGVGWGEGRASCYSDRTVRRVGGGGKGGLHTTLTGPSGGWGGGEGRASCYSDRTVRLGEGILHAALLYQIAMHFAPHLSILELSE